MKILHISLRYRINSGYQDNIITREQVRLGHEVYLMANWICDFNGNLTTRDFETDGVHVVYVENKRYSGYFSKFGIIERLYEHIEEISPDIIFVHFGQFVSMNQVIKYCRRNPNVKLYIDNHSDYYNTPVNTLKQSILFRCIYGHGLRCAYKYVTKYWGVTPWRCQYLHEVYHIPEDKIDLLVMGGEDEYIHFDKQTEIREEIRDQLNILSDDFVIITGGKIDAAKNIHLLMEAIRDINNSRLKLIVFGEADDNMKVQIEELSRHSNIRNIGWIEAEKVYDYYLASDLAFFPGTHSVLWEQACACGLPIVVKHWLGMEHIDLGGNCLFIDDICVENIKSIIMELCTCSEKSNGQMSGGKDDLNISPMLKSQTSKYVAMKQIAMDRGVSYFSYKRIAAKAIGIEEVK